MKKIGLLVMTLVFISLSACREAGSGDIIMSVNGPVKKGLAGMWLTHEHVLVDFIGADSIRPGRYDADSVIVKALPFIKEAYTLGCRTFAECTPEFLGRDPLLLKKLSELTGISFITNTGYYGAGNNKFIPAYAFEKSAEDLAGIWTQEWTDGIGDTGIKPGFIKIAVNRDTLSEFHAKLARAAAITHLKTGLTIASHTGPAIAAFPQIAILKEEGVSPEAFIWVHAQNEKDRSKIEEAALMGAWISLDNVNERNFSQHASMIIYLKEKGLLKRVLVSHDAGWYDPGKPGGGDYRGYSTIFARLIPALKEGGVTEDEINQVFTVNPAEAFTVKIRKTNI